MGIPEILSAAPKSKIVIKTISERFLNWLHHLICIASVITNGLNGSTALSKMKELRFQATLYCVICLTVWNPSLCFLYPPRCFLTVEWIWVSGWGESSRLRSSPQSNVIFLCWILVLHARAFSVLPGPAG